MDYFRNFPSYNRWFYIGCDAEMFYFVPSLIIIIKLLKVLLWDVSSVSFHEMDLWQYITVWLYWSMFQ